MRIEILGSGGATTTPRPGCGCRACAAAREHGGRHRRTGPSVFVHGPDIVFDTPEEAKFQFDRAQLDEIAACFYSHWHPDHTQGRRVWESRNGDFRAWPPSAKKIRTTPIYLPEQVAVDHRQWLGAMAHLEFMQDRGWIEIRELRDGDVVEVGGVQVRPFRLAEDYVYAFELSARGRRVLLAMDELHDWVPPADVRGVDLAVLPMGIVEHDVFTGERLIHEEHPILRFEATFADTLAMIDTLEAGAVVLHHIEEMDQLTLADLDLVQARERANGRPITFAWDGFSIEVGE